jgi:N-acetylglucosamine-6-phosphate deacetylase
MDYLNNLKITNGKIITPFGIVPGGTILVTGGVITAISETDIEYDAALHIDARGKYVSPGFIDIHVHGGGGHDFMDATEKAFLEIAHTHVRYGTTAMLPTTLTGTTESMLRTLEIYELANAKNSHGAQFLGMHLEGPYFAMSQRGAQDPRFIRNPDPEEYRDILSKYACIKRWSAAPELEGAIEFAQYIQSKGVLPALAHTDAVYDEVIRGFNAGYTLATHLYSGMSGVTRRNAYRFAGVVESAFLIDGMDVEIIADGAHLPAPLLQLIFKIKGIDRIALITDAMRAAGTTVTESVLGNIHDGLPVIIEDGVAKLPDRASFAGSVATADRLVRTMVSLAGVSIAEAVTMITATPARILGVQDRMGELAVGKAGDIVIFDEGINVAATIIKGRVVYQHPEPTAA